MVRVLQALAEDVPSLRLVELKGGDKHNAIPREAFAAVLLPTGNSRMFVFSSGRNADVLRHMPREARSTRFQKVCFGPYRTSRP